jgi:hypothetical protein
MQIKSKSYFAAHEGKEFFEKGLEMDQADLHFPVFLPAFLHPAF